MISKVINISENKSKEERPVAVLVQVASKYDCHIDVEYENKKVNAKSIMGMMSLGLMLGKTVTVYADGIDEQTAIEDIEKFLCTC
ncbi:MAG: HPr family phosphocarrier protein [Lachnospiraceae bacterium]|nr:HPr family phosphocarrier protein [Lachnospiraceae bacterium]